MKVPCWMCFEVRRCGAGLSNGRCGCVLVLLSCVYTVECLYHKVNCETSLFLCSLINSSKYAMCCQINFFCELILRHFQFFLCLSLPIYIAATDCESEWYFRNFYWTRQLVGFGVYIVNYGAFWSIWGQMRLGIWSLNPYAFLCPTYRNLFLHWVLLLQCLHCLSLFFALTGERRYILFVAIQIWLFIYLQILFRFFLFRFSL
jgi:hypothetical protein